MKHKYAIFTFPFYYKKRCDNVEELFFNLFNYAREDRTDLPWIIEASSHSEARDILARKLAKSYLQEFPDDLVYLAAEGAWHLSGSDIADFFEDEKVQDMVYEVIEELVDKYGEPFESINKNTPFILDSQRIPCLPPKIQFELAVENFKTDMLSVPFSGEILLKKKTKP